MRPVLKKPLVTEKVTALNEKGTYGFVVRKDANKLEIKDAVEKTYGVNVDSVKTMIVGGKAKTRYTSDQIISGKTPSYKKAIITLKAGEIIDFYSGI